MGRIQQREQDSSRAEAYSLHPAFRQLGHLKEAFTTAAQELVWEHQLQHKLRSDKGFQLQYLVRAIQA
eukprot:1052188-Alexandrium_andersonii.AAC.1